MCDRVEDLALYPVSTRLAHVLIRLAEASGRQMVAVTHDDLARLIGTRREEVTRALRRYRRQGLITTEPGRIRIEDLERLKQV